MSNANAIVIGVVFVALAAIAAYVIVRPGTPPMMPPPPPPPPAAPPAPAPRREQSGLGDGLAALAAIAAAGSSIYGAINGDSGSGLGNAIGGK